MKAHQPILFPVPCRKPASRSPANVIDFPGDCDPYGAKALAQNVAEWADLLAQVARELQKQLESEAREREDDGWR